MGVRGGGGWYSEAGGAQWSFLNNNAVISFDAVDGCFCCCCCLLKSYVF